MYRAITVMLCLLVCGEARTFRAKRSVCSNSQFECQSDKTCIPDIWRCDGDDDCPDGEDENLEECDLRTCSTAGFRCSDSKCIPESWHCDEEIDCTDGSDELNCSKPISCKSEEFSCTNLKCIPNSWKCDGDDDCGDGSDEKNCCKNGSEGKNCCVNGSEGENCCKDFLCNDMTCIPNSWACDGDIDCKDGTDEKDCKYADNCPPGHFKCSMGNSCRPDRWRCDGIDDCGDNSDEKNCEI